MNTVTVYIDDKPKDLNIEEAGLAFRSFLIMQGRENVRRSSHILVGLFLADMGASASFLTEEVLKEKFSPYIAQFLTKTQKLRP
jgi:hypothetical protein